MLQCTIGIVLNLTVKMTLLSSVSGKLCFAALPSLFGVMRALGCARHERLDFCHAMFDLECSICGEEGGDGSPRSRHASFQAKAPLLSMSSDSLDIEEEAHQVLHQRRRASRPFTALPELTATTSDPLAVDSIWTLQQVQNIVLMVMFEEVLLCVPVFPSNKPVE